MVKAKTGEQDLANEQARGVVERESADLAKLRAACDARARAVAVGQQRATDLDLELGQLAEAEVDGDAGAPKRAAALRAELLQVRDALDGDRRVLAVLEQRVERQQEALARAQRLLVRAELDGVLVARQQAAADVDKALTALGGAVREWRRLGQESANLGRELTDSSDALASLFHDRSLVGALQAALGRIHPSFRSAGVPREWRDSTFASIDAQMLAGEFLQARLAAGVDNPPALAEPQAVHGDDEEDASEPIELGDEITETAARRLGVVA